MPNSTRGQKTASFAQTQSSYADESSSQGVVNQFYRPVSGFSVEDFGLMQSVYIGIPQDSEFRGFHVIIMAHYRLKQLCSAEPELTKQAGMKHRLACF